MTSLEQMAKRVEKGTVLGDRFRLDELIGRGGMGSVYAAFDAEQGYKVAVKLLNPRLARETEYRERFLGESKLAASIPHPHILTVHAHGEDDGWHYIATRLVEDDLGAMLEREGPLETTRALNIADQVAWALDVAHEQGLVHRDVKPENVLVTPRRAGDEPDHAYLCDFGIAKLESAELALTRTGAFIGTVSYASPEQVRGDQLDGRSDQYSLACVLYESLAGRPPFSGNDAEAVMAAHCESERPRVSQTRPGLPEALDEMLARGMARHPEERYERCRELIAAARAAGRGVVASSGTVPLPSPTVVEGEPAAAPQPRGPEAPASPPPGPPRPGPAASPPPAAPATTRRLRGPLIALAAVVAALVTGGAVYTALLVTGEGGRDQATVPGTSPAPSQDPEGAEEAIRQTVAAYAGAEGEQQTCGTLTSEERGSICDTRFASAQPTRYEVQRVEVADDQATVKAVQAQFGDPVELQLVRRGSAWLIDDIESFGWKTAEDVEAATVVHRFARRGRGACELLSRSVAAECSRLLPREPLRYDVTRVSTSARTASVSAQFSATDTDVYSLVEEVGQWRIASIE